MKVFLLRHGAAEGNPEKRFIGATDSPLLPEGEEQARLAARFAPQVEHVYTSPLSRCRKTAEIIWPQTGGTVVQALRETDFGPFEGKSHRELAGNPLYEAWLRNPNGEPGGCGGSGPESPEAFAKRLDGAWRFILADAAEKRYAGIAVVSHGGVMMRLMSCYAGPVREFYAWAVENCGGYMAETEEPGMKLRLLSEFHIVD